MLHQDTGWRSEYLLAIFLTNGLACYRSDAYDPAPLGVMARICALAGAKRLRSEVMDGRFLRGVVVVVLLAMGCSRQSSPPPTAAARPDAAAAAVSEGTQGVSAYSGNADGGGSSAPSVYRVKETIEFDDVTISGNLEKPGSPAVSPAAPQYNSAQPPPPPDAIAIEMQARRQAAIAKELEKGLEEMKLGSLGAFGSASPNNGLSDALFAPAGQADNPLRAEVGPTEPRLGNPLREARIEAQNAPPIVPSFGGGAPSFGSAAPSFGGAAPGYGPEPPVVGGGAPPTEPSGGATPPVGGLAEIERAFAEAGPLPGAAPSPALEIGPRVSAGPQPAAPPVEPSPFDVVEVFYGTDRLSIDSPEANVPNIVRIFLPTLAVGILGACLLATGITRRSWLLGCIAVGGIIVSGALGYDATGDALALVRGMGKQGPRYTTSRSAGGKVQLGRCEITVPKTHAPGELESPSILHLEVAEDVARHLILEKTEPLADASFYALLKERVEQSAGKELFVFVHGFNVSFEDAARRTAQIHYDLKFSGAPVFFSWPAHDRFILTYPADETNVAWSTPHFKQFLLSIVKESGARSINLIAHSMGNRALTVALREIELELHDQARLFNQVILAAPDIDADDFRNNIAPAMQRTAKRLTLYASSHDEALMASQFIHRSPRAGDAGDGLIVIQGIDTIDVTAIDSSLWGHSYYGSSNPVLRDLRLLLSRAVPPRDRVWLSPAERDGLTYWIFQPARTAAAEEASAFK